MKVAHEVNVYVEVLDKLVNVKLVDDSPAVLSVGTLCDEMGCSFSWNPREHPQLTKDRVTIEPCSEQKTPLSL